MSEKYITYRADRNVYQIKLAIPIQVDGKVKRTSITKQAKTLDVAIKIRDNLIELYKLDKSLLLATTRIVDSKTSINKSLLGDVITKWYETEKKPSIELQTQRRYNSIVANIIIPIFGHMFIKEITHDVVQQMIMTVSSKGYVNGTKKSMAISSLRVVITILKQFFDYCKVPINPVSNIKYPKSIIKKKEYLTENEVSLVLAYIKKHTNEKLLLYKMFFETGCRRGELLGLTWRYVDFNNRTIKIQQTLVNNPYTYGWDIKSTPKNKSSQRLIYVSSENINHLRVLYDYALQNDIGFNIDRFVFLNKNRKPYCPKKISETFKNVCKAVGITKNVSLHSTRHTFATKLINNNIPLPVIQQIGGWGKATTLLNVYSHSDTELARQSMEKVIF